MNTSKRLGPRDGGKLPKRIRRLRIFPMLSVGTELSSVVSV
jgi:hypothetical protein